jgi:hypothetical protein
VVINDLDGFSTCPRPLEADTPLIVDANTVLTESLAFQHFESIAWRNLEIRESGSNLQLAELSPSCGLNVYKPSDALAPGKGLGVRAPERPDHAG